MTTSDTILLLESAFIDAAERAELNWRLWDGRAESLAAADRVWMGRDWERLRGWRSAGHAFGVMAVIGDHGAPDERALLEPLALLENDLPSSLREGVQSLTRARRAATLELERGTVDLARRQLLDDPPVRLSQREADLLGYLASREGRDVTREELQLQVWQHRAAAFDTRSVDMAIARLRKKIERDPRAPRHLLTSRGGGYRLTLQLPVVPTPDSPADRFFGRVAELDALGTQLESGTRLLTLVGAPGSGKTRMVREFCARRPPDSVVYCDLVPCDSNEDVLVALATALGLTLADNSSPFSRVLQALKRRGAVLLVLDNAEHVLEAVTTATAEALKQAPELCCVVTSQVRLELRGEHVLPVEPLAPADAQQLFIDRARAAAGHVEPGPELAELVERLDCLPLALELAAARTRSLEVTDLLEHLDHRLDWLDRGPKDADPRHRGLSMALRWSWGLLDEDQRRTLGWLGCFRGGFTPHAAAEVLDRPLFKTAEAIESLEERSLVVRREGRFVLLESVRAFAREQLETTTLIALGRRHAQCYARVAEQWLPLLKTRRARPALDALNVELGNLTVASEALEKGPLAARVSVVLALDAVHRVRGGGLHRRSLLTPVIEAALRSDQGGMAAALLVARGDADRQGPDYNAAAIDFREAAGLFERLGELDRAARALVDLAYVRTQQGDADAAFDALEQALGLVPEHPVADSLQLHLQHKWRERISPGEAERMRQNVERLAAADEIFDAVGVGVMISHTLRHLGDYDALSALRERLLVLTDHLPERNLQGSILGELGLEANIRGDYVTALELLDRATALLELHGSEPALLSWLLWSAIVAMHAHAHERSRSLYMRFLVRIQEIGDSYRELFMRHGQVCFFLDIGAVDQARHFFARVEELTVEHETPLLRLALLQLLGMIQLFEDDPDEAAITLRMAHDPGASASNLAHTLALQAVVAARRDLADERRRRGEAMRALLTKNTIPGHDAFVELADALVSGNPDPVRRYRDGPAHTMLRLAVKGWLP